MVRTTTSGKFVVGMFAAIVSSGAMAADNGIYLGAGVVQSQIDVDTGPSTSSLKFDGDATRYKLIVGVRPLDWLAFEANYIDFGTIDTPASAPPTLQATMKLKGYDAFAVALYEVALVDIYAKAGVVRWDQSFRSFSSSLGNFDDSGFDFAYGAGVQFHLGSLAVRGEYEKFNTDSVDVGAASVSVTWTFF